MGWGLANFLPRLASNHDPPNLASQVARIIGVSHCAQLVSISKRKRKQTVEQK
jgi:hypothetical protein